MKWTVHVARMGNTKGAYRVLVEKPEGKKQLGRRRHRWEDNIKMDLKLVGRAWTGLTWLRTGTSDRLLRMQ